RPRPLDLDLVPALGNLPGLVRDDVEGEDADEPPPVVETSRQAVLPEREDRAERPRPHEGLGTLPDRTVRQGFGLALEPLADALPAAERAERYAGVAALVAYPERMSRREKRGTLRVEVPVVDPQRRHRLEVEPGQAPPLHEGREALGVRGDEVGRSVLVHNGAQAERT